MEVLLLSDIKGIGKKSDVVVVGNGYALNYLLPSRSAIVVTPNVRKRYAEMIKKRALEREQEKATQTTAIKTIEGKSVQITSRVAKTGKLYAAITAAMIADALLKQHNIKLAEDAIRLSEPIKNTGTHQVPVFLGDQSTNLSVQVKEAVEPKTKKKS